MDVISEFNRLVDAIAGVFPEVKKSLSAGASAKEIASLEKEIGFALPADIKALLELHNGQSGSTPAIGSFKLLSIDGIKNVRNYCGPIFVDENKTWLPIGSGEPFELVLDCNPDTSLNRGVFTYEAETHAGPTYAPTLAEFFNISAEKVAEGSYRKLLSTVHIWYD